MMTNCLPVIEYNRIPKVLLLGNGINRSFEGESWSEILKPSTSERKFTDAETERIKSMPFPLQAVALSCDKVDETADCIGEQLLNIEVGLKQREIISGLVLNGYDAILTTNYSYEIEKSLCPGFSCKKKCKCGSRHRTRQGSSVEEQYGFFRYYCFDDIDAGSIWHIHGEAALPSSIILGHYYYGKLLSYIQNYAAGTVSYYKQCISQHRAFIPHSWIDYFLVGNVTIIGCGLDLSEMDLWWLINCKKRNFSPINDSKVHWIEPNLNDEKNFTKRILAEAYGIEITTEAVKSNDAYVDYYESLI